MRKIVLLFFISLIGFSATQVKADEEITSESKEVRVIYDWFPEEKVFYHTGDLIMFDEKTYIIKEDVFSSEVDNINEIAALYVDDSEEQTMEVYQEAKIKEVEFGSVDEGIIYEWYAEDPVLYKTGMLVSFEGNLYTILKDSISNEVSLEDETIAELYLTEEDLAEPKEDLVDDSAVENVLVHPWYPDQNVLYFKGDLIEINNEIYIIQEDFVAKEISDIKNYIVKYSTDISIYQYNKEAKKILNIEEDNYYTEVHNKTAAILNDEQNSDKNEQELEEIIANEVGKMIDTPEEEVKYDSDAESYSGEISLHMAYTDNTTQEKKLCVRNYFKCREVNRLAGIAANATSSKYRKYTRWQGNGDAFRHGYWSALMTKHISRDFAYKIGLAHENLTVSYNWDKQSRDKKMDISNNYSGRKMGTTYKNYSDSNIGNKVASSVNKGNYKRIRVYSSKTYCPGRDENQYGTCTKYVGYYKKTSKGGYL